MKNIEIYVYKDKIVTLECTFIKQGDWKPSYCIHDVKGTNEIIQYLNWWENANAGVLKNNKIAVLIYNKLNQLFQ